jgi:sugar phosphate isomerase/epimerase
LEVAQIQKRKTELISTVPSKTRRTFLKKVAAGSGVLAIAPLALPAQPASSANWTKRAGLELYTVRDQLMDPKNYESTLAKIAEIGYKEVEPADQHDSDGLGYAGLDPKGFRALLDRHGLTMPSTHSSATEGPGLEKTLEAFQVMGIKYTEIFAPRTGPHGLIGHTPQGAPKMDAVKRNADRLVANGRIARKFGIKQLVRMDPDQFAPLADHPDRRFFEVILANTPASLVTMQLDSGWASVLGLDIPGMFKKNPGRYELWHIKDAAGLKRMTPGMTVAQRRQAADLVPVGLGLVDFKTIFAHAGVAGLKHYCIEQDNAAAWGDSVAAARVSYNNLVKMLS